MTLRVLRALLVLLLIMPATLLSMPWVLLALGAMGADDEDLADAVLEMCPLVLLLGALER